MALGISVEDATIDRVRFLKVSDENNLVCTLEFDVISRFNDRDGRKCLSVGTDDEFLFRCLV